jgi:hypothetical protein
MTPLRLTGSKLTERNNLIDFREQQCCARCGIRITENGSRHHRKLKSRGGGDEVSNGVLLCGSGTTGCHGWVHANPKQAEEKGWMISSGGDPKLIPIVHAIHGKVWLDDEGGISRREPVAA